MSDQPNQHASASRIIAHLGALLPSLSALAIVAGALWFVVSLTISPIEEDVNELKALQLGASLAKINTTLQNIERRLHTIEGRLDTIEGRLDTIDGKLISHTHPVNLPPY